VTRLIADVATAVVDLDHRVVVDKPKSDPEGCVSSRRVGGQAGRRAGLDRGHRSRLSRSFAALGMRWYFAPRYRN
jgi:hypothetical protein